MIFEEALILRVLRENFEHDPRYGRNTLEKDVLGLVIS